MSMKNSNDTIGNRNRDLPACRAVPQSTAPPRAPHLKVKTQAKRWGRRWEESYNIKRRALETKSSQVSLAAIKFFSIPWQ
jgi:hypothetical protein